MTTTVSSPAEFTARARIRMTEHADDWQLVCAAGHLSISRNHFQICYNHRRWQTDPEGELWLQSGSEPQRRRRLSDARRIQTKFEEFGAAGGMALHFADFPDAPGVALDLFVGLNWQTGECVIELSGRDSPVCRLREVRYPGSLDHTEVRNSVLPFMQGILLPADWPEAVRLYTEDPDGESALFHGRSAYMPWFGAETNDGGAVLLTVDTPDDAGIFLRHPPGGPTRLEPRFVASLGEFTGRRKLRVRDFTHGNYVTLAQAYRETAARHGLLVKLTEKIARTPRLERMIGTGVLHGGILYHYREGTHYHDPVHPEANYQLKTYDFYIERLEALKSRGFERLYFHLDGWGWAGYDACEPDSVPVGTAGGGIAGLRQLSECSHRLGYLLALHQQYRDNYLDAAGFDPAHLLTDASGNYTVEAIWAGGPGAPLCAHFSAAYLERNNRYFQDAGLNLDGSYLDVFSVTSPDECFHPQHRMTRSECRELRADCFRRIRDFWGIVSSEEPADWSIPYLDCVHHAPWPRSINPEKGAAIGIPVPLFNLVYHDCLVIPWNISMADSEWGFPPGTVPFLAALLNGGVPYVPFSPSPEEQERAGILCRLHRQVGCSAMVNHEFLNSSRTRQRTTFANGVTVTVDHATREWQIEGGD